MSRGTIHYESGAFSEVFDLGANRLLKAFVVMPISGGEGDVIPRLSFAAELALYSAMADHPLGVYLPQFFGQVDPLDFPLASPRELQRGCGLLIERIPGHDSKLAHAPPAFRDEIDAVVAGIREVVKLEDPWDGSCFIPGSRSRFTLIDVATPSDTIYDAEEAIRRNGRLSLELRRRLGIP